MGALPNLSFEEWINHAFSQEVRPFLSEWYWETDCDYWDPEPRTAVAYLTELFTNGPRHLECFSEDQVAQGLRYLTDTSIGMQADIGSQDVPVRERAALWPAVATFFRDFLMPRTEPSLGYLSEKKSALGLVTYMWWDAFPSTYGRDQPDFAVVMNAEVQALSDVLELENAACQEAALHGLGHLTADEAAQPLCIEVIDRYLQRREFPRAELEDYARGARSGCVL